MSEHKVCVLVYSDDKDTRQAVIEGIGSRCADGRSIEWIETATAWAAVDQFKTAKPDVLILDSETRKIGGMAVARQIETQFDEVPPVILLAARPQDQWLANWVGAAAVALSPLRPDVLQDAFAKVFSPAGAIVSK